LQPWITLNKEKIMNVSAYHLGSILKAASDLSPSENPCPTLKHIQEKTGLTTAEMVAALEYEPHPLGWHLERVYSRAAKPPAFTIRGQSYNGLVIDRFAHS
jgi:hypothetical protein